MMILTLNILKSSLSNQWKTDRSSRNSPINIICRRQHLTGTIKNDENVSQSHRIDDIDIKFCKTGF